jgi:hypothetical protein
MKRPFYIEILLVCAALLLLEISYTRVISFKLFYFYTYLIIGVALLGIGSGGVFVAVVPRLRVVPLETLWARGCLAASLLVAAAYAVIVRTPMDTFTFWDDLRQPLRLLVMCFALYMTFLPAGILIAALFGRAAERVNRLYCADLVGAGLACAVVVPLLATVGPPGAICLGGAILAGVGARLAAGEGRRALVAANALVAVAFVAAIVRPGVLPVIVPDKVKTLHAGAPVLFSRWSPVFRVDVTLSPVGGEQLLLHHDGLFGSTLQRFDGDFATLGRFDGDDRSLPFRVLGRRPRNVLIIGSAGGHEILASLYFGAEHVTGVELNPVTVSLLEDTFADYTGRIAHDPRVTIVNGEGRSFLARSTTQYDLIYFVAPDSYAAMNAATSGAFVLSESYLYTKEMLRETLRHLAPGGVVSMQFGEIAYDRKPNRTTRYLSTARLAFRELGISDLSSRVLVATRPNFVNLATMLLKQEPFTAEETARFVGATGALEGMVVRHAGGTPDDTPLGKVLGLPDAELAAWYAAYPYDVTPVTDDAPFFWHFARFGSVLEGATRRAGDGEHADTEDSVGERLLLGLLVIATAFAATFLLLPFALIRDTWRALPHKGTSGVYFACLGVGFMLFEIALIQKLTLFLGYPTYSLTVTLMAVLVSTGLGSLLIGPRAARSDAVLRGVGVLLAALTVFYVLGLGPLVDAAVGLPLAVRIAITIAIIVPLGLALGAFMPAGLARVAAVTGHGAEYVAWSWAVNGFFSVIGSVLTTILSMSYGFQAVLVMGFGTYVVAILVLRGLPTPAAVVDARRSIDSEAIARRA